MIMLRSTHSRRILELTQVHLDGVRRQREHVDHLTAEIEKIKQLHADEVTRLRGDNVALRNEIATLKGKLVAQDHAEGKTAGSY